MIAIHGQAGTLQSRSQEEKQRPDHGRPVSPTWECGLDPARNGKLLNSFKTEGFKLQDSFKLPNRLCVAEEHFSCCIEKKVRGEATWRWGDPWKCCNGLGKEEGGLN